MKKLVLLFAALAALAASVAGAAFAGGPAPKATGDFSYANPWNQLPTHITFVAQDLGNNTAKGNFTYQDPIGSYQATVTQAHIDGNTATFTVVITSSTGEYAPTGPEPRPAGTTDTYQVVDNRESGVNDTYSWVSNSWGGPPYSLGPLTAGNIQVH
jgi:hypothetical protein